MALEPGIETPHEGCDPDLSIVASGHPGTPAFTAHGEGATHGR